jgi:hypothetical protein
MTGNVEDKWAMLNSLPCVGISSFRNLSRPGTQHVADAVEGNRFLGGPRFQLETASFLKFLNQSLEKPSGARSPIGGHPTGRTRCPPARTGRGWKRTTNRLGGAAPASRAFAELLETARCARLLVMRIVVKKVGVGPVICRVKDMG